MGDVIAGRFELLESIARGGTGSVWRAWDRKYKAQCAAKVLRQRDSADLLRFVREQSITSDHPHLLTPYGWAAEDTHVVIAMPLATGGTAADAVSDFGAFGASLAATILEQVLAGLSELHATGWVHRDIKPANVMFPGPTTGRPQVQVADFGLALHRDDVRFTRAGMVHGTAGFMAPEVLRGEAVGPAQDIFAAGVTAVHMLDPQQPLPTAGATPDLPDVHADLVDLIAELIAFDPEQRPSAHAARTRIRAIAGLLDGPWLTADGEPFEVFEHFDAHSPDAPTAALTSALPPHESQRPRRRGAMGAALISGAAVLGGIALIWASASPSDDEITPNPTPPAEQPTAPDTLPPTQEPVDAGQPCSWAEENSTRSTTEGTTVTCVRQDDGSYAWE